MGKKKLKIADNRPWYHQGLRFECQACGRCCGGEPGYIWATHEELARIAETVGMHVLDFCQMYVAEYEEGFSLREMDNGDCCMLQGGKCRVYGVRPMQCRTWPFWPSNLSSPRAWQEAKQRCPGMDRGRLWSLAEIERRRNKVLV